VSDDLARAESWLDRIAQGFRPPQELSMAHAAVELRRERDTWEMGMLAAISKHLDKATSDRVTARIRELAGCPRRRRRDGIAAVLGRWDDTP